MKKTRTLLLLLTTLFSLISFPGNAAQEAPDLTSQCAITVGSKAFSLERLRDRDWHSIWNGENSGKTITITSPQPIHGLYICWAEQPRAWTLEEKLSGSWQASEQDTQPFLHQYVKTQGAKEIRLKPAGSNRKWFGVAEIFVLGEGAVPSYVQRWRLPDGQCDLMVFFAHPDDESLFFGGTLPTYAGERQLDVVASCLTASSRTRRSELLNSLWTMGVSNYPVFGPFSDKHSLKLATAYKDAGGENKVQRYVVGMLRAYKPLVVVTHDTQGEYGHGMHRMVADAALKAFEVAADSSKYKDSAQEHGPWQVQKLYLHLYPDNIIEMDWDIPLAAFQRRTGFEMAQEGYLQHQSQQRLEQFKVEPRDSQYSSYLFGLARTMVGPDEAKNDFFEHLHPAPFLVQAD